jgi:hypothetical protein
MNSLISSIFITVISGGILMILDYWIIKPIAENERARKNNSTYGLTPKLQKQNGLAIASFAFGLLGILGNIISPFSVGLLGFEGMGICCIPSLFFATIGLVLGLISKNQNPNRYSLSGITSSLIAIGIFILFFVFLIFVDANSLWCDVYPSIYGCP